MSHSRQNSRGGSGVPSGNPTAGPSRPPTGATAVSRDCVGFQHNWPCGHQQNLLVDGHGCLLTDDTALTNHVHWMFDLGDDGFPCPVCGQEELSSPRYYPPVAEQPGRTPMDDLEWRLDSMAHDPHFRQLRGEVDARTPVPEPMDPWRRLDPPEMEDLWQEIVTLGMRLMQMRREPQGPGSGPPDTTTYAEIIAARGGLRGPEPGSSAPSTGPPTAHQGQQVYTGGSVQPVYPGQAGPVQSGQVRSGQSGTARRRSTLNAATAFRGEFIPGHVAWTPNRLSRRQAARARAAWSMAQHPPTQLTAQSSPAPRTAPAQGQYQPPQMRGMLTRASTQPTRMNVVVTAEDLDEAKDVKKVSGEELGGTEGSGEASAGAGIRARVEASRLEEAFVAGGEDLYGVSDEE